MIDGRIYKSERLLMVPLNIEAMLYLIKAENSKWAMAPQQPFKMLKTSAAQEKKFWNDFKPVKLDETEQQPLLRAIFEHPIGRLQ